MKTPIFIITAILLLSSCKVFQTRKDIATSYYDNHKGELSIRCDDEFPTKIVDSSSSVTIQPGTVKIVHDTVKQDNTEQLDQSLSFLSTQIRQRVTDSIKKHPYIIFIHDTFDRSPDTITRLTQKTIQDTRKLEALTYEVTILSNDTAKNNSKIADLNAKLSKNRKTNRIIIGVLIALAGLGGLFFAMKSSNIWIRVLQILSKLFKFVVTNKSHKN